MKREAVIQFQANQMVSFVPEEFAVKGSGSIAEAVQSGRDLNVLALEGYLSRELKNLEKSPNWHRLPNGVAVFPRSMLGPH